MYAFYEKSNQNINIFSRKNRHYPPHLHPFLECVYLQKGTLAVGQGQNLYPMEAGDLALIFPNTIHHYQVFDPKDSKSIYFMVTIDQTGIFSDLLTSYYAKNPIIPASQLDPEVKHALRAMLTLKQPLYHKELLQAYLMIILAKSIPCLELEEKKTRSNDLVYDVISYISAHFKEEFTLNAMASDLGISPYVLSRVFSGTFHTNFKTYINEMRLKYACNLLRYSDLPVTNTAMESGFSSLRTFNRFCKEKLRMTPREYRSQYHQSLSSGEELSELDME